MKSRDIIFSAIAIMMGMAGVTQAQTHSSAYSKLNFDRDCVVYDEYQLGVSAKCSGYNEPGKGIKGQWPVYFSEGDLRQMVRFGHVREKAQRWESFGQFNQIGNTIEWRLRDGKPIAAILRWFIENTNPETGMQDKEHKGQVLVVSTVADLNNRDNGCVVGYVDARINPDANVLARDVADNLAADFKCGEERPKFYGERSELAGNPTSIDY